MLKFQSCENKLYSDTKFEDFCVANDGVVLSLFLDDAAKIKEVCQKTIKSLNSDAYKENELNSYLQQWT